MAAKKQLPINMNLTTFKVKMILKSCRLNDLLLLRIKPEKVSNGLKANYHTQLIYLTKTADKSVCICKFVSNTVVNM